MRCQRVTRSKVNTRNKFIFLYEYSWGLATLRVTQQERDAAFKEDTGTARAEDRRPSTFNTRENARGG